MNNFFFLSVFLGGVQAMNYAALSPESKREWKRQALIPRNGNPNLFGSPAGPAPPVQQDAPAPVTYPTNAGDLTAADYVMLVLNQHISGSDEMVDKLLRNQPHPVNAELKAAALKNLFNQWHCCPNAALDSLINANAAEVDTNMLEIILDQMLIQRHFDKLNTLYWQEDSKYKGHTILTLPGFQNPTAQRLLRAKGADLMKALFFGFEEYFKYPTRNAALKFEGLRQFFANAWFVKQLKADMRQAYVDVQRMLRKIDEPKFQLSEELWQRIILAPLLATKTKWVKDLAALHDVLDAKVKLSAAETAMHHNLVQLRGWVSRAKDQIQKVRIPTDAELYQDDEHMRVTFTNDFNPPPAPSAPTGP